MFCRLEDLYAIDIKFLHGCEMPTIAYLAEVRFSASSVSQNYFMMSWFGCCLHARTQRADLSLDCATNIHHHSPSSHVSTWRHHTWQILPGIPLPWGREGGREGRAIPCLLTGSINTRGVEWCIASFPGLQSQLTGWKTSLVPRLTSSLLPHAERGNEPVDEASGRPGKTPT